MGGREALLFANDAFYRAFADGDLAAMETLWAEKGPVACLHPGWPPLEGRDAVMDSWASILQNPGRPQIECRNPRPFLLADSGFVICYEAIGHDHLLATNVFAWQDGIFRMVHHQAGPADGPPPDEETSAPAVN